MTGSESSPQWRHLTQDGATLACADYGGDGVPLLILYGLCGHAGEWSDTASWLAQWHHVVVPDARGHGLSERRPADVSRDAYVSDAARWLEHLELAPAVVVGQSLGGHTAFLLAARRPELVRALVVVEATPDAGPSHSQSIQRWLDSWPLPFATRERALEFFGGDNRWARAWADGLEQTADGLRPRFDTDIMIASLAETAERSYWDEWSAVRCPTLIVRGENGVPRQACQRMERLVPSARLVDIKGAGHDPHLEQINAFHAELQRFLATISGRCPKALARVKQSEIGGLEPLISQKA